MKEKFLNKIKNKEYISKALYDCIIATNREIVPQSFDLEAHNQAVLEEEYNKYQNYFNEMYKDIDPNIHLDRNQIEAIISDEDYSLIIAGAGTGKTTTMASKVKYLVDIKKVDPSKIVVMSFTKKATEELEKRIVLDFEIPAKVTTFHSLGLMCIREIFSNRKCYVVDNTIKNDIFLSYFKEKIFPYKDKIKEILDIFDETKLMTKWVFGSYFKENYDKYDTFDEYFTHYKQDMLKEVIKNYDIKKEVEDRLDKMLNMESVFTIKGELVKSKGEAQIANFLYCHNIEYRYEKIYRELMEERRAYHPDFTLNLNGEEVYLEYFGLSNYEKEEMTRYDKIRKMKENYHETHHTKFIALDYYPDEDLIDNLKKSLLQMGFKLKEKTYEEIYLGILDSNPTSQFFHFKDFLYNIISVVKASPNRKIYKKIIENYLIQLPEEEKSIAERQYYYINDFYLYYQTKLFKGIDYGFDFSDMLYYANLYLDNIKNSDDLNFEYLIIDEYQDISQEKYEFTTKIANKNHAKVVAVGDDWQSIYSFSGSKIEYIYNFSKYFPSAKILRINKTYRNSQTLIDYSGEFVMKNEDQIKKKLISDKELKYPIKFVPFDDGFEYETLKKLILKIHSENKGHHIMILARTNAMINKCFDEEGLKDEIGTKITFVGYEDIDIDGMTIHKSKGLTSDEVIIIGLNQSFPHTEYGTFWMKYLFKSKEEKESVPYAEERRIFYVGLTRTKNYVYLLVNKNPRKRSPFINELYEIINNQDS